MRRRAVLREHQICFRTDGAFFYSWVKPVLDRGRYLYYDGLYVKQIKELNRYMTQQEKISNLKQRLEEFMGRLDNLDPEQTSVEDIDRLISMLESLERSMDE